ncbi:YjgB family protein [Caproiciproducens galactitolivorans]|uniref:YjgB family protein n=1 Tax=Caproiciproducens galactitolivorans TaxID=642589 RepID=A0ABT4BU29_9FIRM|nr:YjgB family protein [Caproiciproducens galactitolivorans]MCY1714402.1 YjgB family protein [Caproiciproducens galactitolivorans]
MITQFKKILASVTALALLSASFAGCSHPQSSGSQVPASSPVSAQASSSPANPAASSSVASAETSSKPVDEQTALLQDMQKAAKQGKVLDIPFSVKTNVIEDVQQKWGKEDKSEYIASAKGIYNTYSKHNAVFGFNKGDQLFEVRTLDGKWKDLTLSKVKEVLGKPDHDVKYGKDEIIGYVASKDYKILLVFPADGDNPKLDHYSVLYPQGTVNSMAGDPGRQW